MCLGFPGQAVSGHADEGRPQASLAGGAAGAAGERQSGVGDAGRPAAHRRHPSEPADALPRTQRWPAG